MERRLKNGTPLAGLPASLYKDGRSEKEAQPPFAARVDMSTMKEGSDQPTGFEGEDAALWELLGKVPPPPVSPYFSRRVFREIVRLDEERGSIVRWLRNLAPGWRLPHPVWSGALAAALVGVVSMSFAFHQPSNRRASPHGALRKTNLREDFTPRDVEVIANLDNLMADEENRLWTDESNTD